jgi:predicted nucleic-acid-binding Zn-ribbon protein
MDHQTIREGPMSPLFDSTKADKTPASYVLLKKTITCPHCGKRKFEQGSILLNTPGMTFLGLDWANRTATTLLCTTCGQIQWFIHEPERAPVRKP